MVKAKIKKIIIVLIIVLIIGIGAFYFLKQDKNTLTVSEKNWIESNKNNLIDLYIPNTTLVLSYNGKGVVFDLLDSLESDINLEFNKLSYENETKAEEYVISGKDKLSKKDLLLYEDCYALITNKKVRYNSLDQINKITIGVLEKDLPYVTKYLTSAGDITYKKYTKDIDMIKDLEEDKINAITLPKLKYLDKIIKSNKLNIAYNITEYKVYYTLKLGNNKKLNNILIKYYKKWSQEKFDDSFNKNLVDTYFTKANIPEEKQVRFHSKRYNYGFVTIPPFDIATSSGLKGYNHSLISKFAKATDLEFTYKKYSNFKNLNKALNKNELDIIFNYSPNNKYDMDTYKTISPYNEKMAIIGKDNIITVNNITSLKDKEVLTIKNSKIEKYLKDNQVKTKSYDNLKQLVNHINKKQLAAIDYYSYDYYIRTKLNNFQLINTINLNKEYNFISRDIAANETFNKLFDFYLSFNDTSAIINSSYLDLLTYNKNTKIISFLIALFSIILLVIFGILAIKIKSYINNRHKKLSKADKLHYIDSMTSLKNRNYLNDNIDSWDNSDIYPQTIIIVDLNNIAYINDNFGHSEGDKVIIEAAGILISNQLSDSEIIRTNGNEFLIFTVGHDEKSIISYIRKLKKEFKNLSHGFGATIGYSMITDEIKTVDDAVNEATADMKDKKENQ